MPTPTQSSDIFSRMRNFSLKAHIMRWYTQRDVPFWSAVFYSFVVLNIIFLFHGAQYLFGDHDWTYIKQGVPLSAGLFEGRFTQFLLINILSAGEILPLINNILGFSGYTIGLALLAKYWQLPHTKQSYVLFTLFAAITPYLLAFMYFAFLVIPILSWNAFVVGALLISAQEKTFSPKCTISAILLFTLAIGGYPPVINLIAVAITARILLLGLNSPSLLTLKSLWKDYRWSLFNLIAALTLYKLFLMYYNQAGSLNTSYYNLQTLSFNEWPTKLLLTLKNLISQFWITLPFITISYKITTILLTLTAFFVILNNSQSCNYRLVIKRILLFIAIFLAGLATFFISTYTKETEFAPRIDFFGFNYAIAAMFALCLKYASHLLKNITTLLATFCLVYNAHILFEAQKVWKLGFDAERALYKRVLKRYETAPLFNINSHYIMIQSGAPTFRHRYYYTAYTHKSDDLLGIPYTPTMNTGVMWNFDAQREYASKTSYIYTFKPDTDALHALQIAQPYPAEQSVQVGAYWILITFSAQGLDKLRAHYH